MFGMNPPPMMPPVHQVPIGGAPQPDARQSAGQDNANRDPNLPPEIDQEFFNSLPEDCKQELLRNDEMLRRNLGLPSNAPASTANIANAEQIDTASFLVSLVDENLRREILIGMDDNTLATLPPRLQADARRYRRENSRRHYRREAEDPTRILRRIMEGAADSPAMMREIRNRQANNKEAGSEQYHNLMDIIRRREERNARLAPEASDISKNTISVVFGDDKNLKNLLKIVIIESQRKSLIKFERLVRPLEHLSSNALIRLKLNQALMQILNNFKMFSYEVQYSYIRRHNVYVDHIFPPVFIISSDTKTIEEIQYPKVALLVFKIYNSLTNRYSAKKPELIKSFFTKEPKKQTIQVPTWFTQFDKDKAPVSYIEDSPFLCLLKYILSDDFYSNQNDMAEMLKIASSLLKKYAKPLKEKVVTVDSDTLEVLFKLITLKVGQDFIKQICNTFTLISFEDISRNMQKSILEAIPEVRRQLTDDIRDKAREKERALAVPSQGRIDLTEEIKAQLDGEELIDTAPRVVERPRSLSAEGPTSQSIVQETREKSLMLEKAQKLERLLKVFRMLLHQYSRNSRSAHIGEDEKAALKKMKESWVRIIDMAELKDLFEVFGEYLSMLSDHEVNDTVKMIGLAMFLCYQEDFKRIDAQVFTENFNLPNITMQSYQTAETKSVTNFIDDKFFKNERISFFIDL